jgi:hypothetical protein
VEESPAVLAGHGLERYVRCRDLMIRKHGAVARLVATSCSRSHGSHPQGALIAQHRLFCCQHAQVLEQSRLLSQFVDPAHEKEVREVGDPESQRRISSKVHDGTAAGKRLRV